ncbi:hypothetical protein ABZP36_021199 [Zizania latifolia]
MKTKVLQAAAGGKRWSPAISTVLVAVLMTMPPLVVLFSGRIGEQAIWIKTAVAGIRQEEVDDTANRLMILDKDDLNDEVNKSEIDDKGKDLIDKDKRPIDMSLHLPLVPTDYHASVQAIETCQVEPLSLEEKVPLSNEDLQFSKDESAPMILPDKKKLRRKKEPAMAVRQSSRIKRDVVPIQVKAQQRADQMNNITGVSRFTAFCQVNSNDLAKIALDYGVFLGNNNSDIEQNISTLKVKEMAQALIILAKHNLNRDCKLVPIEDPSSSHSILVNDFLCQTWGRL